MSNSRPIETQPEMTLGDIYYVLFRHKWKIIILSAAGLLAAGGFYIFHPPLYQSQAELLIKYVPEAKSMTIGGDIILPASDVDNVINSEIQILTSMDVAEEVATNLGASTILARAGGGDNPLAAAALVRNNLHAEPTERGGSVILVTFRHPNPQIVQPVLQEVISDYFQKHYEIHQASGQVDENMSREEADLQLQLEETERQLTEVKNKANILSLDNTRNSLSDQITKIRASILDAEAQLGQYGIAASEAERLTASDLGNTNGLAAVPPEQIQDYRNASDRLKFLHQQEQNYVSEGFSSDNTLVKQLDKELVDTQKISDDLEKKYPQLSKLNDSIAASDAYTAAASNAPLTKDEQIADLKERIDSWKWQLGQLWEQASNINNLSPVVAGLERTEQILETNYENLAVSLEQAHINEALATDKAPNIRWVQAPSPPFREWNKTYERMAVLAVAGILAGLAWAFLIEMYLDRTVKRPIEIETKLKMPFFLSIPDISQNGHARVVNPGERQRLRLPGPEPFQTPAENPGVPARRDAGVELVSQEENRSLRQFFNALRDRLINYFEIKNLTHNPKLVAVTSANPHSGVSTIAMGLAVSLSKTGEGNVLLIDMNQENGMAQHFYKGKASYGLDTALDSQAKGNAQVQENLYVVSEDSNSDKLPRILPKRFSSLMPKLRASEYDYIIFDMPPVSQTSVTPRIARFMDMVLMVVESEKTDREVAQRANKLLVESGATVHAVLNKTRNYVPKSLHQGYLGDT